MNKEITKSTNYPAIRDALAYCSRAIAELQEMRLSPALDAERTPSEYQLLKMDEQAGTGTYLLQKLHEKIDKWKIDALKSPKASAGKREAPAIPGPAPKPAKEPILETYKRQNRAGVLGGAFKYGSR